MQNNFMFTWFHESLLSQDDLIYVELMTQQRSNAFGSIFLVLQCQVLSTHNAI